MNLKLAVLGMVLSTLLYSVTSYLILLRDPFLLERVGISAGNQDLESYGLVVAQYFKVTVTTIPLLLISIVGMSISYVWIGRNFKKVRIKSLRLILVAIYFLIYVSYPALSNDVFDYNNANRVAYVHGHNPWQTTAKTFPDDPHIYMGSWIERPSVYPPITFLVNTLVFFLFGGNPLVSIWGFKLINILLVLILSTHISKLFPKITENQKFWLFANPLLLIEFIGNAHNDLLLGVFLLLAVGSMLLKKPLVSGIFFTLSVLAKVSSAITLPIFVIYDWVHHNSKKWLFLLGSSLTGIIGLTLFLISSPTILETLTSQLSLYQKSLPGIVRWAGLLLFGRDQESLANLVQKLVFIPIYFWVLIKSVNITKTRGLVEAIAWILLLYLLLLAPMVQPWYLAWILPLLVLLKASRIRTAIIVFSISSLLHYPIFYMSLFFNPTNFVWQIVLYLVMAVPPVFVLYSPLEWYTKIERVMSEEL